MEWVQQPERADKWQRFTKRELAKGAPPSLRKNAKLRNEVLAVLVEHNHLLVDGNEGNWRITAPECLGRMSRGKGS